MWKDECKECEKFGERDIGECYQCMKKEIKIMEKENEKMEHIINTLSDYKTPIVFENKHYELKELIKKLLKKE